MRLVSLVFVVILNLSSAPLHNVILVVGDEGIEVGSIKQGEYRKLETPTQDSCRVIFTLGQKREGWLGTDIIKMTDTIKINDNTKKFDIVLEN